MHGTDEILQDSLRIDEISEIVKLLIFKLSFSKPFWNNSNYASIANIREVSYESFHNLGEKSFETGFRKHMLSIKQYELLLRKITIQEGECKFFTVLCSLGKLADSPVSVS